MNQATNKFQESSLFRFYRSFSPASRAVILFAIPFSVIDAIHYYTAGTALIFSFPLLIIVYLLCGAKAASITFQESPDTGNLASVGRSAGLRLWLTSTILNTIIAVIMVGVSLGMSIVGGAIYLCFAPLHMIGSSLVGWLGGWLYQQYLRRIYSN